MPKLWDEKSLKTNIQIELKQNGATVNYSRPISQGILCFRITSTFIEEIIDLFKRKIDEKEFLHHLTLNLKSPHNQLTENHKNIKLEEVYKVLESSITNFLTAEVNHMKQLALREEKNSGYCLIM